MNKVFRCPLCGSDILEFFRHDEFYQYACTACNLAADYGYEPEEALECVENLLKSFPGFMRIREGDKLHFINRSLKNQYWATVTEVDLNDAWIKTDKGSCRPDDVLKWPWELEQKKSEEDENI